MKTIKYEKQFYFFLCVVCAAFSVLLFRYGHFKTFWMDDIAQMDMVLTKNLREMLFYCKANDNNPPLSHLLSYIWIRVVPYGTFYLKLLNMIIVVIGVWYCGLTGKYLRGNIAGIISAVTAATTWQLVYSAAYTFRPYGCMFLFSAVALYYFCKINIEGQGIKNYVLYTLGLTCLIYSHYFGVMVMGMFFLFDMFLAWKMKRNVWKMALPHVIAGVSFLPWLIYIMASSLDKLTTFWPAEPSWNDLAQAVAQLISNRVYVVHIVYAVAIGVVVDFLCKKKVQVSDWVKLAIVIIPIVILGVVYFFSVLFTGFGSLWVIRYFICLMPFIFCLCGVGFGYVFELLKDKHEWKVVVLAIGILFSMESFYNMYNQMSARAPIANEPYEDCADWLVGQEDLCEESTLVFCTGYHMNNGWFYYLTRNGELEEPTVVNYSLHPNDLQGIDKVYVVILHRGLSTDTEKVLAENGFALSAQEGLPIRQYVRTESVQ